MMDYINSLTGWLDLHPHWAGIITFFISLSESLAVLGLIVPGSVMMTTIGALIGSGVLPVWETIIWAILGAVAGDSASYWLGHHYHEQLKRFWPFRTHPQWLERGEAFFLKHGGKSVFIARFIGPMRPIIPVVAGMLSMQPRRFLLANVISAIAWAPAYMIPGILLGFASLELAPETLTRFIFILLGVLLAIWLGAWILQLIGSIVWRHLSHALDRLWVHWAHTRFLRLV
ncbi:MAG: yabI, partial [Gammaproteobacteria bacterium]|nr:yabI [Gammaproteobacteria bacterium]